MVIISTAERWMLRTAVAEHRKRKRQSSIKQHFVGSIIRKYLGNLRNLFPLRVPYLPKLPRASSEQVALTNKWCCILPWYKVKKGCFSQNHQTALQRLAAWL